METGEVLADEDVTQLTKGELHRTLDRPRKIRVEFYAHLIDSDAEKSDDEECDPRYLLDPVDERRSLVETLISMGVEQGAATNKVSVRPELHWKPSVDLP